MMETRIRIIRDIKRLLREAKNFDDLFFGIQDIEQKIETNEYKKR